MDDAPKLGSSSASSPKVKEEHEETVAPAAPSSSEAPVVPPTDAASAQSNPSSRSTSKEPRDRRSSFPKSKLTGEVNPFELSFSKPSPDFTTLASLQSNGDGTPGGKTTPGEPKPSLPSIGHITTPLAENEAFTWPLNTPAISSLRSGMEDDVDADPMTKVANLPTPATSALIHHALSFDPSNFVRTGLTPGTGMTPLTGGPASFPPPSPNTAAFLAMVQNATAGATNQMGGVNGTPGEMPLMTPGTFNNVMSQLSQIQDGGGPNGQTNGAGNQQQQQPDYFSHRPDGAPTHIQQQLAQAGGHPHRPESTGPGPSGLHQVQYPHPAQQQQQQIPPGRAPEHYLQQSAQVASQAANGLYLLSQAHQEIAKREQDPNMPPQQMGYNGQMHPYGHPQMVPYHAQAQQFMPGHPQAHPGPSPPPPLSHAQQQPPNGGRKSKRKSSDAAPAPAPAAKKTTAAAAKRGKKQMSEESELHEGSVNGSDVNEGSSTTADLGRPETEEEKRKNFLERNRQAALKCRQRKKAWLNELQGKVEALTAENEGLSATVAKLTGEVHRLQAALAGCGPGAPPPPSVIVGASGPYAQQQGGGRPASQPPTGGGPASQGGAQRVPAQPMVASRGTNAPSQASYAAPPAPQKVRV